ncbi:MAG: LytTR family DNA-binding domain-containing protein [Cyclobacteriaceae bacterium]
MESRSKIRVLIADDEKPAREAVKIYLESNRSFEIVAECEDGVSTLKNIEKHCPDLLLLDIEMPELNGMDLLKELPVPAPHVVFITAYHHYAVRAFEENAIDYLLKPFDRDRFEKMLEKVLTEMDKNREVPLQGLSKMLQNFQELKDEKYLSKIPVKRKGKILFIPVDHIIWIESSGSFTKLHLADSIEISNSSISQIEKDLDPTLHIRIHKSHMVNLDKIKSIESYFHGEYIITLSDGTDLKLSRSYKNKLNQIMNQYKS